MSTPEYVESLEAAVANSEDLVEKVNDLKATCLELLQVMMFLADNDSEEMALSVMEHVDVTVKNREVFMRECIDSKIKARMEELDKYGNGETQIYTQLGWYAREQLLYAFSEKFTHINYAPDADKEGEE